MIYMCKYTWYPGTTSEDVNALIAEESPQQDTGVTVRGYYTLVGGGAGYFLLEADDPQHINDYLVPTMGLIAWDVRQVIERDWEQVTVDVAKQLEQQP